MILSSPKTIKTKNCAFDFFFSLPYHHKANTKNVFSSTNTSILYKYFRVFSRKNFFNRVQTKQLNKRFSRKSSACADFSSFIFRHAKKEHILFNFFSKFNEYTIHKKFLELTIKMRTKLLGKVSYRLDTDINVQCTRNISRLIKILIKTLMVMGRWK